MPDVGLEQRRTGMFEEQSLDRRERTAVDRIGIIVKADRERRLACKQASMAPATGPTSHRGCQNAHIRKSLLELGFQTSVAQDDEWPRARDRTGKSSLEDSTFIPRLYGGIITVIGAVVFMTLAID